jgi:lysophospholipase L1-like esterase
MFGKRQRNALVLIGIAIAIFAGFVLLLNTPPVAINTTENGAEVAFRSTRGAVLFSGECINVSWEVENIVAVYLNNRPTVGQGEQAVCIYSEAQPTLRITTQDGSEIDYTLNIEILTVNPLANIGILLAITLLLSGIYLLAGQGIFRFYQSAPIRRVRQITIPIIIIVLITLFSIEAIFRIYIASNGTRDEQAMYLWSREEINAQDQLVKPVPYLDYIANPENPEHNKLGYRGEDIENPKPEGVFRIVALGGSTTYSTGTSSEESYPAVLQQILRDEYGYTQVEVINGGMSGYSSWENLINFAFRVLELEPDMIIIYAAVNDVVARESASNDCYRGENALRGLNVGRGLWVEPNQPLSPSALYRFIGIRLGWMSNPLDLQSAFKPVDIVCQADPEGTTLADRVEANIPTYFERNMRSLLLLAKGNNVIPVLSTWSYYVDADRPGHWIKAINQHNDITRQLAGELNVPLYDLANNLPIDSAFWEIDGIHFVAKGTQEQAQQYAQFLDDSGLIQ